MPHGTIGGASRPGIQQKTKQKGREDFLPAKSLTFPIQKKQDRITAESEMIALTVSVILICKFPQNK